MQFFDNEKRRLKERPHLGTPHGNDVRQDGHEGDLAAHLHQRQHVPHLPDDLAPLDLLQAREGVRGLVIEDVFVGTGSAGWTARDAWTATACTGPTVGPERPKGKDDRMTGKRKERKERREKER